MHDVPTFILFFFLRRELADVLSERSSTEERERRWNGVERKRMVPPGAKHQKL